MNKELDDVLQHFGVKGMKWGVRRKRQNGSKKPSKIGEHWRSLKREREWKKALKNLDKMSTKDIIKKANRIQLENDLKRLSTKKGVGSAKDKTDYLRRGKMTDQELSRKVTRLRAKENLHRTISEASKGQREFGKRVVQVGSTLAIKYALTGGISPKDVFITAVHTKKASEATAKEVMRRVKERQQASSKA